LNERRVVERELRAVDRRLSGFDEAHASAASSGMPAPAPTREQEALLERRRTILAQLSTPEAQAAGRIVAHGDRNRAQSGAQVTPQDLAAYRRQRAADLAAGLPVHHERNLRAAGIDPAEYEAADGDERAALTSRVQQHLARERDLLAATTDAAEAPPDENRARLHFDPTVYRERVAGERARTRRERRQQQTRPRPTRR
jgi:hypothetical protein